jgi:hypothetical protein
MSENVKDVVIQVMEWFNLTPEEWESIPGLVRLKILLGWRKINESL